MVKIFAILMCFSLFSCSSQKIRNIQVLPPKDSIGNYSNMNTNGFYYYITDLNPNNKTFSETLKVNKYVKYFIFADSGFCRVYTDFVSVNETITDDFLKNKLLQLITLEKKPKSPQNNGVYISKDNNIKVFIFEFMNPKHLVGGYYYLYENSGIVTPNEILLNYRGNDIKLKYLEFPKITIMNYLNEHYNEFWK